MRPCWLRSSCNRIRKIGGIPPHACILGGNDAQLTAPRPDGRCHLPRVISLRGALRGWGRDLILGSQSPHLGIQLSCVCSYLFLFEHTLIHLHGEPPHSLPQEVVGGAREMRQVRTSF